MAHLVANQHRCPQSLPALHPESEDFLADSVNLKSEGLKKAEREELTSATDGQHIPLIRERHLLF